MRADISRDGLLMIIAENSTEAYALRVWWDAFNGPEEKRTAFGIDINSFLDDAQP